MKGSETVSVLTETGGRSTATDPAADAAKSDASDREILRVASPANPPSEAETEPQARAPATDRSNPDRKDGERLPALVEADEEPPSHRVRDTLKALGKSLATLLVVGLAVLASLLIWDYYVTAPWTRDGRVRVQVASIAPQVSGQVTDLRVRDNQFVHKGDTLYVIDKFDFQRTLDSAQATLRAKAADLQVKKVQAERRQKLSDLATTPEEQQQYVGNATQAQAAFDSSQQDVDQANVNLQRTEVKSPVNGFVTNLLMRVGDYAHEGTSNISVIDSDSYWIDGYFEETKMAHICVGDRAEAQLMGYRTPILGRVATVTRGISVSDAAPSTQGLPNVDPVYTWVRLAQRVPVRIAIAQVPAGIPLVSGMTATVTIRDPAAPQADGWFAARWGSLQERLTEIVQRPEPHARCVPTVGTATDDSEKIEDYQVPAALTPSEINPGLAPGLTAKPQPGK